MKREMGESRKSFLSEFSPNSRDVRKRRTPRPRYSGGPSLPGNLALAQCPASGQALFLPGRKASALNGSLYFAGWSIWDLGGAERGNSSEMALGKVKKVKLILRG